LLIEINPHFPSLQRIASDLIMINPIMQMAAKGHLLIHGIFGKIISAVYNER